MVAHCNYLVLIRGLDIKYFSKNKLLFTKVTDNKMLTDSAIKRHLESFLYDLNKNKTIAEMPDNVNNAILEIIGIGKKEFTKCIALPQGEFDRFLSDTPAIRKKTLAKLFDLEQFGVYLSEKLKKRKNEVSLNKSTLEEKIAVYNGISQEAVDKIEAILKHRTSTTHLS